MKKYRNLILLIIFLLLVGLFFILRRNEPKERVVKIIDADSLAIAKIQIYNVADTVIVYKKDDTWLMSYPDKAATNMDMMEYFFKDVFTATYSETAMNEHAKSLHQYGLDKDKEVQLKLFDSNGKLLTHCRFGNTNNPFDYFRYGNSRKVYQVRSRAISGRLRPDANAWRSPIILSIKPFELAGITVTHPKNSYVLTRDKTDWYYMDKNQQFMIPHGNVTMGKILNTLEKLESYRYSKASEIDKKSLKIAAEVDISLTSKGKHNLTFYQQGEDQYYLVLDGDESRYYHMVLDQLYRFIRHAEVFNIQELSY